MATRGAGTRFDETAMIPVLYLAPGQTDDFADLMRSEEDFFIVTHRYSSLLIVFLTILPSSVQFIIRCRIKVKKKAHIVNNMCKFTDLVSQQIEIYSLIIKNFCT
jgi:hypothetical protein